MALSPDATGELSRYLDMLEAAREAERQRLASLRSDLERARIEQQLRQQLTIAQIAALADLLVASDPASVRTAIDAAQARIDAVHAACLLVKARLDG